MLVIVAIFVAGAVRPHHRMIGCTMSSESIVNLARQVGVSLAVYALLLLGLLGADCACVFYNWCPSL